MDLNTKKEIEKPHTFGRFKVFIRLLNYTKSYAEQNNRGTGNFFKVYLKLVYDISDLYSDGHIQHIEEQDFFDDEITSYVNPSETETIQMNIDITMNLIKDYLNKPLGELPLLINEQGLRRDLVNWRITLPLTQEEWREQHEKTIP